MGRQLKQNMLGKRKYTGPFENVAMNSIVRSIAIIHYFKKTSTKSSRAVSYTKHIGEEYLIREEVVYNSYGQ